MESSSFKRRIEAQNQHYNTLTDLKQFIGLYPVDTSKFDNMARISLVICLLSILSLATTSPLPLSDAVLPATEYVRDPLSDWNTPLPHDDGEIGPVPQSDLK
ncbi:hypothetical protein HYFRA_00000564 [Hymenoscyphus fraxineus]|uniref:Uncharacterized protein n=1 Tax=Hymenoscyphus fraxineus TaxID=746836 RepID=A0A9N9L1P8_9HELO|nr:hypothetical protein HYFRA_00000564 [Hymenoscyphus fraxineus]